MTQQELRQLEKYCSVSLITKNGEFANVLLNKDMEAALLTIRENLHKFVDGVLVFGTGEAQTQSMEQKH